MRVMRDMRVIRDIRVIRVVRAVRPSFAAAAFAAADLASLPVCGVRAVCVCVLDDVRVHTPHQPVPVGLVA